jgi:hypothetical protein
MKKKADDAAHLNESETVLTQAGTDGDSAAEEPKAEPQKEPETFESKPVPWHVFIQGAAADEIRQRFSSEVSEIFRLHADLSSKYCCLAILNVDYSIDQWSLDRIYAALRKNNWQSQKDVLLILLSQGGSIEPAYQISKMCKSLSKSKFVVAIPRQAKSAATLLALGADEIHMGPLGQLGPIDPQLGGLPALGVSQALESIASLAERFPKSSEMFARYLRLALTVEQIGYCERISESAAQYAERLLSAKPQLVERAPTIARELVHEYKDHGFVIDIDEARNHLGSDWVKSNTVEMAAAEAVYNLFEFVNLFLDLYQSKRLFVLGDFDSDVIVWDKPKR